MSPKLAVEQPAEAIVAPPQVPTTFPLSAGQRSLWFMHQTLRHSPAYHVGFAVYIAAPLDVAALREALQRLQDRHAALRSVFRVRDDGELVQQVIAAPPLSFTFIDNPAGGPEEVRRALNAAYRLPFDLENGPVFRVHLFNEGNRYALLLNFHHIVFDGPSMFTLVTELQEIYAALQSGRDPALRPIKNTFQEFVQWQTGYLAGEAGAADLAWWQERLQGAPHVLDLPVDHSRPTHFTGRGGAQVIRLEPDLVDKLRSLAKARKAHLYDVFLAAFQVLLYRYSQQNDFLLGFLTSGRTQLKFAKICGLFINPVVQRARLAPELNFLEFLDTQHKTLAESLERQNYPFLPLLERSRVTRLPGCMPMVQVLFNFFKAPRGAQLEELFITGQPGNPVVSPGLILESFGLVQQDTEFDLALEVADGARSWLRLRYSAELFEASTIARMFEHYTNLLEAIAQNADCAVIDLPLMREPERTAVLTTREYQRRSYPLDTPVYRLIEEQAARTPDRVAVTTGERRLTYAQLNARANALAHYLREQGVGPETLVGVCLERSNEMLEALLAIWKAGGAYVPLDPAFPKSRLELILADCEPVLVLTEQKLRGVLPQSVHLFEVDTERAAYAWRPTENLDGACDGSRLAYVLYTSGSTGKPKGVQIPHGAFTNFQLSMQERPGLTPEDTLLAVTTISFDIAGLELFLPLISGAGVVIASREAVLDGRLLANLLREHAVTVMQATPATWRLLLDAGWGGSQTLKALCGGEALSRELANELLTRVGSLWNMYGPTETTVWSTVHCVEAGNDPVPLGSPVANTTLYILDAAQQPVPIGVPGELYIGGAGVARGYLHRPELTAGSFGDDPFRPGERLYRTGDLCKYRTDGSIAFLGRMDEQVKIRGHRIELGDIESALRHAPQVREVAVVVNGDGAGKRLIAYLLAHPGGTHASPSQLRAALAADLPDYMIPAAFLYLKAFPLTPNNKVDRKALQSLPPPRVETDRAYVTPATPTEAAVAQLWRHILHVERVGRLDRFDELGGDSLAFALMIVRLGRQFQVELPVSMDDEMMTVHGIAAVVDAKRQRAGETPRAAEAARPRTAQETWLGALFIRVATWILHLLARVELKGVEHIPSSGPLILAGNHVSLFDFLILGAVLGDRRSGMGIRPAFLIADTWRRCVHTFAAHLGNPIYIRRGKGDLEALAEAVAVLEAKGVVGIMPEGRPSRRGLLRAKTGIAYLAEQAGAWVLPLAIHGHEQAFRYWLRLRRVPLHIRTGEPFDLSGAPRGLDLQGKADFIMQGIARLLPAAYHGFYAASETPSGDAQ